MPIEIKQPTSPRSQENEFAEFMSFMVGQISTRFKNGVLDEMNKSTVDKFADAQTGNYAKVLLKLSGGVEKKILRQFNNDRIQDMINNVLRKTDMRAQRQLYTAVEKAIGISSKNLVRKEGLTFQINALKLETGQWVKKLRDETLEQFTNNTLHSMTRGQSLEQLLEQFNDIVEKRKGHAEYLARNQIQNYNTLTTKLRAQRLGIKKAIWETSGDESVRPSHKDRDGKEFDLAEGLYSSVDGQCLLPGIDHLCRCTMRLILEDDNDEI